MKKSLILLTLVIPLTIGGCVSPRTIPIDSALLSNDKATLIVFNDVILNEEINVYIDNHQIGKLSYEKPLKMTVEPGKHDIYAESKVANGVLPQVFSKGQIYFIKANLKLDPNTKFVSWALNLEPTEKIESYTTKRFELN